MGRPPRRWAPSTHHFEHRGQGEAPHISDAHFEALLASLKDAARRDDLGLDADDLGALRDWFEATAGDFLVRQKYVASKLTPATQRKNLRRLIEAAASFDQRREEFDRALARLDPATLLSIHMRWQEGKPDGFLSVVGRFQEKPDPDSLRRWSSANITSSHAYGIARAAELTLAEWKEKRRSARRGARGGRAVSWLAHQLRPIFEEVTRRTAHANYDQHNDDPRLGERGTPFIRFMADFLEPIAPKFIGPSLGNVVYDAFAPRRDRGTPA